MNLKKTLTIKKNLWFSRGSLQAHRLPLHKFFFLPLPLFSPIFFTTFFPHFFQPGVWWGAKRPIKFFFDEFSPKIRKNKNQIFIYFVLHSFQHIPDLLWKSDHFWRWGEGGGGGGLHILSCEKAGRSVVLYGSGKPPHNDKLIDFGYSIGFLHPELLP